MCAMFLLNDNESRFAERVGGVEAINNIVGVVEEALTRLFVDELISRNINCDERRCEVKYSRQSNFNIASILCSH